MKVRKLSPYLYCSIPLRVWNSKHSNENDEHRFTYCRPKEKGVFNKEWEKESIAEESLISDTVARWRVNAQTILALDLVTPRDLFK